MHRATPSPRSPTIPLRLSAGLRKVFRLGKVLRASIAWGQGLVEYGLVLMLIAIVVVGAVTVFGSKTSALYSKVDCTLSQAQSHSHTGCGD